MKSFMRIRTLSVLLVALLLAGCGQGKKEIEPEKYVDAYLRASLKGDADDYAELTGRNKDEVKKQYDSSIEALQEQMSSTQIFGDVAAEDVVDACRNLLAAGKYEVAGAKKGEDGDYTVDVKVYASDVMELFLSKTMEAAVQDGGTGDIGELVVNALKEAINEQTLGNPETVQVKMTQDDKGRYGVEAEEVQTLIQKMFYGDMGDMFKASGTVYDNPYFNWTKSEWEAASEEEKSRCCLAITQTLAGYTDEEVASIDLTNPQIVAALQEMKDGISLMYSGGVDISIGDYVEVLRNAAALQ